jgi:hypothetical protein
MANRNESANSLVGTYSCRVASCSFVELRASSLISDTWRDMSRNGKPPDLAEGEQVLCLAPK